MRTNLARILVLVIALVTAAAVAAGCGSSSSSSGEDPQQVLDQTFNNDTKVSSGNLNISLSADASGSAGGNFTASVSGPFESNPNDPSQLPQLDLTADVKGSGGGQSINFKGGVTATQDQAFVTYQDQAYEIPSNVFSQFKTAYAQQAGQGSSSAGASLLKDLGIDPSTWLTNTKNEGTTDIEGDSTIHISGDANVPKILDDLSKVAQSVPNASTQLDPSQISQAAGLVDNAHVDIYSGADDHVLRKLELSLDVNPPSSASSSGIDGIHLDFSITISGVNDPQTINAPSNAKPFSDLQQQLGGLGILGSSLGGSTSGTQSTGGSSSSSGGSAAYTKCVLKAQSSGNPADINKCLSLLK